MSNNPFKPPQPSPGKRPAPGDPVDAGSPLRAVLTGLAIDIGGAVVTSVVLSLLYALHLSNGGMTPEQVKAAMNAIPPQSAVAVLDTLLGALCSVAGGYACARIARRDEYRVGAVMAALSALLGLALGDAGAPDDLLLLLALTTAACVLLGVKYGHEHNRRGASPADTGAR